MVIRIALADLVCFRPTSIVSRLNLKTKGNINSQTIQEILREDQSQIQIDSIGDKQCCAIYSTTPTDTSNQSSIEKVIEKLQKSRDTIQETSRIIQASGTNNKIQPIRTIYTLEIDPIIENCDLNKRDNILWVNHNFKEIPSYSLKLAKIIFQTLMPVYNYLLNLLSSNQSTNTIGINQDNQVSLSSIYNPNLDQLDLALTFIQGTINGIKRTIKESINAIDQSTSQWNFRINSDEKILKKANYPIIFDTSITKCNQDENHSILTSKNKSIPLFFDGSQNYPLRDKNNSITSIQNAYKQYFEFFKEDIKEVSASATYHRLEELAGQDKQLLLNLAISQAAIYHPSTFQF